MSEKKKNEAKCEKQKEVQALDDAALESAAGGMAFKPRFKLEELMKKSTDAIKKFHDQGK